MATWTKINNVITLTKDTTMSELVNDQDIPLVDADTIELDGHNLIVDIITCGSADPDFTDEVNIGVTVKNDGGGECNLEFKDLSGIRLNATLPGTVHPWVDPNNPLPVKLENGDLRIIHNDPYCTKLTANARAEIQLAGNFSLGGGRGSLPTETREGNFYGIIKQNNSGKDLYFTDDFPVHKNDIIINYSQHDIGFPKNIVDSYEINQFKVTLLEIPSRNLKDDTWTFAGGGIVITGLINFPNGYGCLSTPMQCGCLSIVGQATYHFKVTTSYLSCNRFISCISIPSGQYVILCGAYGHACINQCSINFVQTSYASSQGYSQGNNISINEICTSGYGGYHSPYSIYSGSTIINSGRFAGKSWSSIMPTIFSGANLKISNCYFYKLNDDSAFSPIKLPIQTNTAYIIKNCSFYTFDNIVYHNWYENAGIVSEIKQNNSWHHKPKDTSSTTWRYEDRIISPHKSLHLKISRLVESTSSLSEARVAITDTANWYPETKFGAYADIVIRNIETDKWQIYNLKYKNESDEPLQVRVWECVSGSTDGGYLKVEEATGGPM